jgi:hypothetical protein
MYISKYYNKAHFLFNKYMLHYIDCITKNKSQILKNYRPIFIIGAPRCGSTLMIQVITDAFNLGYFSNAHCRFFGAPTIAEKVIKPLNKKKQSNYKSFYGGTLNNYSPSECGNYWYRFFCKSLAHVSLNDVDKNKMLCLRKSIASLSNAMNRPIVFKNLYSALRIQAISKYLPEAIFIIVKRNELDNARSILEARMKNNGNYSEWWSVPHPKINEIKDSPPEQQVVEQIRSIYEQIDIDTRKMGLDSKSLLTINYEEFCDDVYEQLDKIKEFLIINNIKVQPLFDVPATFQRKNKINIDIGLNSKLTKYVKNKI